jgi:hypothetical protein
MAVTVLELEVRFGHYGECNLCGARFIEDNTSDPAILVRAWKEHRKLCPKRIIVQ